MKNYPILIVFIFASCGNSKSEALLAESSGIDTIPKNEYTRAARILPKSEFEITEGGIGNVLIGDSFISLDDKFSNVDTLSIYSEGFSWPAKKIDLGNNEWILAESGDDGFTISRLHTNSKKIKTTNGFYIGLTFDEVLKSNTEISVNIEEGVLSIRLHDEKVSASLDSASCSFFYNSKELDLSAIPKTARIVEFAVY